MSSEDRINQGVVSTVKAIGILFAVLVIFAAFFPMIQDQFNAFADSIAGSGEAQANVSAAVIRAIPTLVIIVCAIGIIFLTTVTILGALGGTRKR